MNYRDIVVRIATPKDYRYCYNLTKRSMSVYIDKYRGGWNSSIYRKEFNPEVTKIIKRNNRRVGFYVLKKEVDHHNLDNLQISPLLRGKGLGSHIMRLIHRDVSRSDIPKIRLLVFKGNPAKSLYQRFNYKVIKDTGDSYKMEIIL